MMRSEEQPVGDLSDPEGGGQGRQHLRRTRGSSSRRTASSPSTSAASATAGAAGAAVVAGDMVFCRVVLPEGEGHVTVSLRAGVDSLREVKQRVSRKLLSTSWFSTLGMDAFQFLSAGGGGVGVEGGVEGGRLCRLEDDGSPLPLHTRVVSMVEKRRLRAKETSFLTGGCAVSGCTDKRQRGHGCVVCVYTHVHVCTVLEYVGACVFSVVVRVQDVVRCSHAPLPSPSTPPHPIPSTSLLSYPPFAPLRYLPGGDHVV